MELDLKNLLSNKSFSRKEKILILLASTKGAEKPVVEIRELAVANGLRDSKNWNISQLLKDLDGAVVRLPDGWALTEAGLSLLDSLGIQTGGPSKVVQPTLRRYASSISSPNVRGFVEEAIAALELNLYRSAVVLSWVGAVSVFYEVILVNHLPEFNAEAIRRFPKWKTAKTIDDLSQMKEYDLLQVLHGLSVIGKNTKDELEHCLKLRNACGHPNNHRLGEHRVTSHIETLILNVFSKHAI
ncbi:hypothetical protein V8G57_15480 [Collimonas sp. H4R21]|uniref:DUF4145 domain-containing protein n=1 Tax=Collimonas rhizosphaerae TaxID=3126357 RepID=A0ABU9PXQ5_9BURK